MKADELGKVLKSHADRQADLITDVAKLEIKSTLKNDDGTPREYKMDSPMMKAAVALAQERGWTKGDLVAMADFVGTRELAAIEADKAEFLSLGAGDLTKANARYNAVLAAGAAKFQADESGKGTPEAEKAVARILAAIHSKADFEIFEKLVGVSAPGAAEAGGGASNVTNIAESWYGKDGLSGPGVKKAS